MAEEPTPEFGGYFMFTRDGVPVAGGMGDMGDMPADNSWKVYLATDDIAKTVKAAEADGAELFGPAMPVADLGIQAVLADPTGAALGAWQPGTFPGFTVLGSRAPRAGSSSTPGTTPPPSPSTTTCSAGRPTPSATPTSSATR